MVRSLSRHRLPALLCGVLAAVLTVSAPAAAAPPTSSRSDAAAGWLARQLVDGERFKAEFGGVTYPDQGLTIDAIFAFAAAKVADHDGAKALTWLARPEIRSGYVGDGTTEAYAGATAKLTLAAQVRGADPTAFGGVDLVEQLRGLEAPSGRFSDRSAWGDYSNWSYSTLGATSYNPAPATVEGWSFGSGAAPGISPP